MAGIRLEGNTSGNVAEVDTQNQLLVNLPITESGAGYAVMSTEVDSGAITNNRFMRDPECSEDYRLRVSVDTFPIFSENFVGAAVNSSLWQTPVYSATVTVAAGFCSLNNANNLATGMSAKLQSYRCFPTYNTIPLYIEQILELTELPVSNNVVEWGWGFATGTIAPTDGVFWRLDAGGELKCVMNIGGTETQSTSLSPSLIAPNITHHYVTTVNDDRATFWVDDVMAASMPRNNASATVTSSPSAPIFVRTYNKALVSAGQQVKVGMMAANLGDATSGKSWESIRGGAGDGGYQWPTGLNTGATGSTALYTNSLITGSGATASNTAAALGSGLGGQFTLQPAAPIGTDGIISSYQVPLLPPFKNLYIRGVKISGVVTSPLVGGPVISLWSLAFGHTAVSLATAESSVTKAPRRLPLGVQTIAATSAVGVIPTDIVVNFNVPILIQPGEFVQTVMKNAGTITTSGAVCYLITFDSYWE